MSAQTLAPVGIRMKIKDAKLLKDTMTVLGVLVDEGTFHIDAKGLKLRAMDPSRVAMVDFEWPAEMFEEFKCEKPTKICFLIDGLLKLIKRTSKDDTIELSTITTSKRERLQIAIIGKTKRDFTMPLLETSEEEVPTPKINFNARIKATLEGLKNGMDDVQVVSDHVKIEPYPDMLLLTAQGDLMGAAITMKKEGGIILEMDVKEHQKAVFSLQYLNEIIQAASALADLATLEVSTDMPLKLTFHQPAYNGMLSFYLAPRIETEES